MKKTEVFLEKAMYIKAEESYSKMILIDGKYHFYSKPMKHYTATLLANGWFKIHRSYMVNPFFVKNISACRENICLLNGTTLPISRRNRTSVLKWRNNKQC